MLYALVFGVFSIWITLRYPPTGICIYLLGYDFVSTNESFAFLNFGSNALPLVLVMICYAASIYRLISWYASGKASHWLMVAACASVGCAVLPIISLIASGKISSEAGDFVTYIIESGPLLVLPALAYGMETRARTLFAGTVLIQIILAFLILNFPVGFLANLNAANYHHYAQLSGGVNDEGTLMRAVGQFSTPIQLGAYATICLAIGIILFKNSKNNTGKAVSGLIIVLGVWGEYISFTRGILLGLIFALVLYKFPKRGWKTLAMAAGIVVLIAWAGQTLLEFTNNSTTSAIARHLQDATNPEDDAINYRVSGLKNSMNIIREDPIFGICSVKAILDRGEIVHFYPGWIAAMYGLPAGAAVLILFLCAIRSDLAKDAVKRGASIDKLLSSLFGWTAVLVLSSNFMGGRAVIWIMLGFACLISARPSIKSPQ